MTGSEVSDIEDKRSERDQPPSITELFEQADTHLSDAASNLGAATPDRTLAVESIDAARQQFGQIRTRLRGCWLDPVTDEEDVDFSIRSARLAAARERVSGQLGSVLDAQLGRIIPATSKILIDVSLQAAPLLAARTPRAHIEVETTGMDPDEIQKVTEVARDAAEDTAEFFKPRVTVSPEREGADAS